MTGSIKDYTPNFEFIIPEFNITGWHDYLEENFRSIDALFYNLFGINNFKGQWKNSTVYNVNDVVFIGEDTDYSGKLVKVLVQHTTASSGNFTEFFTDNPSYYELFADASTAQIYAQEARDWAVKTDGPVKDNLYSSKYYSDYVRVLAPEIISVYNIRYNIQTVSNISEDVVAVSGIKNSVQNVSDNRFNINIVANNKTNIDFVANNINNINDVYDNLDNINAVNNNKNYIDIAALNSSNITTVADSIADVKTNATNISAINTNANNMNFIQTAQSNAQSAYDSKNLAQEWAISTNLVDNTDYSSKYWAGKSKEWAESVGDPANKSLSNLNSQGQNIANWSSNVTNCITEIPQDIKLELNNGTLTLKAGSKLYVPNGLSGITRKFIEVITTVDYSCTQSWNGSLILWYCYDYPGIITYAAEDSSSGNNNTIPRGTTTTQYYNTVNNTLRRYENGSLVDGIYAFPLALVTTSNGAITSIDQVFNGFGYIGSTVFALPGVKGLIPNGRNEDGTLKNTEFTINNVLTRPVSNNNQFLTIDQTGINGYSTIFYNEEKNLNTISAGLPLYKTQAGFVYVSSNKITSFLPATVYHALNWNDKSTISGWGMPSSKYIDLTLGASGSRYTAPANGWFCLEKSATAVNQYMYIGIFGIAFGTIQYSTGSYQLEQIFPVKKGQEILINYTLGGATQGFRFVYAEGGN